MSMNMKRKYEKPFAGIVQCMNEKSFCISGEHPGYGENDDPWEDYNPAKGGFFETEGEESGEPS